MKNNQFTFMLMCLFFLTTVGSGVLLFCYKNSTHEVQDLRLRVTSVSSLLTALNSLGSESVEYSKKDPGLAAVLQSITNRTANAAAAKPPGK